MNAWPSNRRSFLKKLSFSALGMGVSYGCLGVNSRNYGSEGDSLLAIEEEKVFWTPGRFKGMPIKATYIDEISWDIPHQNWGYKEWDAGFAACQ